MWNIFVRMWKLRDLRRNFLVVLGMLVIFRIGAHIPIPGIDPAALQKFFQGNQVLGLLNVFTGGSLENFSIVLLGVAPYITASIIMQLLTMIVPSLEALQKEGEWGQRKINQWTRMLTVPLAILQGFGTLSLLRQQASAGLLSYVTPFQVATILITVTAGSVFLMWLGELMTEQRIGNGLSLLIFAGIVSSWPLTVQQTLAVFDMSQLPLMIGFLVLAVLTVVGVVFITEGQRNIPVSYARRIRGNRTFGGVDTYLPLRVNMAGVIPIIFAISIILFPPLIAQFLLRVPSGFVQAAAQGVISFFNNQTIYGVLYFLLVFGFTYFYTAVIFHPTKIAENLQQQGGFVPGIRPGIPTATYLGFVTNRIMLAGALFLGLIAVLPIILQGATGMQNLVIGGTSILIVVSVILETVNQLDAQLKMREYEGL